VVSSIQCVEAVKVLLGKDVSREMLFLDIWNRDFQRIKVQKLSDCPCCVRGRFEFLEP
jgi:hypothetical protein